MLYFLIYIFCAITERKNPFPTDGITSLSVFSGRHNTKMKTVNRISTSESPVIARVYPEAIQFKNNYIIIFWIASQARNDGHPRFHAWLVKPVHGRLRGTKQTKP